MLCDKAVTKQNGPTLAFFKGIIIWDWEISLQDSSIFIMEKDTKTRKHRKVNDGVLKTISITVEVLNILKCMKTDRSTRPDQGG